MGNLIKNLLYVVLALVAVVVIATVSLTLFYDPNNLREQISDAVEDLTGRELVIEGDLELSLFPWLAVDIGRTTLGNAPGFGDAPFASFEQARLSVRLLPLLISREVKVGNATLEGMQLNLAINNNGRSNWQDLVDAMESAPEETDDTESTGGELDVAGFTLSDAAIRYSDGQTGNNYQLTNLNLDLGRVVRGEPIDIQGGFDFELQPADLAGDFAIETAVTLGVEDMSLTFSDAEVTLVGIDMHVSPGDGSASFETEAFSLKELMQRLNMEPIATADASALQSFSLRAVARQTPDAIALDELHLVVDDTTLDGRLSLAMDESGTISVDLAGDSIELDRYMAPVDESAAEGTDAAPVEIPTDLIRALNVRGNLTLDEARLGGMTFEAVKLGVNAANGRLRMHPINAQFFDGTYDGDVSIDASGETPVLSVNENVSAVNVGALAAAMFEQDDISGAINGSFRLTGRGTDVTAMQRSLNGTMSFELLDGAWEGTDVWYELRRARSLLKKEPAPEAPATPRTRFSNVVLSGPVRDGVFTNDTLQAELPFMRITGTGTVDLATTAIDYRLTANISDRPEGRAGLTEDEVSDFSKAVVPLRVTGELAAPSIKPDLEAMIRDRAKEAVQEKVQEKEDEVREKVEERVRDRVNDRLRDLLGN